MITMAVVEAGSPECKNLQDCLSLTLVAMAAANQSKSPLDRTAAGIWVGLLFDSIFEDHLKGRFPELWGKA